MWSAKDEAKAAAPAEEKVSASSSHFRVTVILILLLSAVPFYSIEVPISSGSGTLKGFIPGSNLDAALVCALTMLRMAEFVDLISELIKHTKTISYFFKRSRTSRLSLNS